MAQTEGKVTNRDDIQQDDNYREFYDDLVTGGLHYIVAKRNLVPDPKKYFHGKTRKPREIIVVGAGMAGLSAAYELEQAGHKTKILEMQARVGGRVKTFREGFSDGLHAEGGAMRLPGNHFLTHHYLRLFNVNMRTFSNYNDRGYLYIYGRKIRYEDWKKNNGECTTTLWPGWDKKLTPKQKEELHIDGILDYYDRTIEPVLKELHENHSSDGWDDWVKKWSMLSVEDFLRSDIYIDNDPNKLRPWPEEAILAYKTSSYSTFIDCSMVEFLREELGGWWKEPLTTPADGMDCLPKEFIKKNECGWNKEVELAKNIHHGIQVTDVKKITRASGSDGVLVKGKNVITNELVTFEGDAAIVTVPLTILRQLDIDLSEQQKIAITNVTYEPSTKVLLQCRTRFWQPDVGQGGFTKTNLPIGQIHYPDWNASGIPDDSRGILVSYTWGQDALIFGSQPKDMACASAVKQLSMIHPEITKQFEVGAMKAWFTDLSAQGAFAYLRPFQYNAVKEALIAPNHPIYLAGEAISWANGWIQGALVSGLVAAYRLYKKLEPSFK